ncbi:MAG: hypothetical protein KJZ65_06680 [Phycisphaerales bacterium]|nr:hypothetical protein [Phycisphaerales bacterium]
MGFEIKNLKTADGKPVSLEGIDAKIVGLLEVVGAALTTQVETAVAGVGETVKTTLTESLKPITTQIEEIKKTAPAPGAPTPKPGEKPAPGDDMPAWAKGLVDSVTALANERAAEKEQVTVAGSVKAYLDKHLPNLGDARAVIERRLVALKPKDEAAIKQAVTDLREEYRVAGVDVKKFDADPKGEGAKDQPKDDSPEAVEAKKIKALREGPRSLVS